ncbi:E3 ubiquitin-protein ligase Topors-like isoform X2 [Cloeon dipterum]|uniref:E3 ubiquitin-protein ligase Topors-like isoform X2 n=1 Tax=Cloeon dipterum TaxID=197152 RepID=UPI0032202105
MEYPPTPPHLPEGGIPSPEPTRKSVKLEEPVLPRNCSPEPNCTICLGPLTNQSNTDICAHKFCFDCILTWSKVKSECPLCKQKFSMIYHEYKEDGSHEVYTVPRPVPEPSMDAAELHGNYFMVVNMPNLPDMPPIMPFMRRNLNRHRLPHLPPAFTRFRRSTIPRPTALSATSEHSLPPARNTRSHSRLLEAFQYRPPITTGPAIGIERRRQIYALNQWALPLPDVTLRSREHSLAFYVENPAMTHRLTSWILRDLSVLLSEPRIAEASQRITELLLLHDLKSREFYNEVHRFLGDRTRHFMHELTCFASSPYDMLGYDRHVSYGNWDTHFDNFLRQSNENGASRLLDDEDIMEVPVDNNPSPTSRFDYNMRERLNFYRQRESDRWGRIYARLRSIQDHSVRVGELLSFPMPSESSAFTAFTAAPAPAPSAGALNLQEPVVQPVAGPSGIASTAPSTVEAPIVLDSSDEETPLPQKQSPDSPQPSDDDDDDVEVVGEFRPRRLQTPEVIEINSDLDELLPEFVNELPPMLLPNSPDRLLGECVDLAINHVMQEEEVPPPRPPSPPPMPLGASEEKKKQRRAHKKCKRESTSPSCSVSSKRSKHKKHKKQKHHSRTGESSSSSNNNNKRYCNVYSDASSEDESLALLYKPPKMKLNLYSSSDEDEGPTPLVRSVIVANPKTGGMSTSRY